MTDGKVTPLGRNSEVINELKFLLERAEQGKISRIAYLAQGKNGWSRAAEITSDKKGSPGRLIRSVLPPTDDDIELV